jgi:hypothetical protein
LGRGGPSNQRLDVGYGLEFEENEEAVSKASWRGVCLCEPDPQSLKKQGFVRLASHLSEL